MSSSVYARLTLLCALSPNTFGANPCSQNDDVSEYGGTTRSPDFGKDKKSYLWLRAYTPHALPVSSCVCCLLSPQDHFAYVWGARALFEARIVKHSIPARMPCVTSEDARRAVDAAESFFMLLGAGIMQRKELSIKALVDHPDGFQTVVSVKASPMQENITMSVLRCSGDKMLFNIIHHMLAAFDMGRGVPPAAFWDGQILPRPVKLQCSPPPLDLPFFRLEGGGQKRKIDERARGFDY